MNSLAAANQEVSKALMDLAGKDSRFRKGLGSQGSAVRGRGRGGAGRGRSQVRCHYGATWSPSHTICARSKVLRGMLTVCAA